MNITKEYINECDCPEVQGLKPKLEIGDYIEDKGKVYLLTLFKELAGDYLEVYGKSLDGDKPFYKQAWERRLIIWLPTGDQLTDLIFKHCHTYNLDITLYHEHHCKDCSKCCIAMEANYANGHLIEKEIDIEAREYEIKLAKIKLLKELLKESEE